MVALQFFDSAIRVNPHLHGLFADGVFTCDSVRSRAQFHPLPAPTDAEVALITKQIAARVLRLLRNEELVPDPDAPAFQGGLDLATSVFSSS